ncbi:MAG: CRISPR-associated protein Cas4 [Methanolobus sp.]
MFRSKEKPQLTVSDLSLYFSCPRKLYYSCRGPGPVSSSSLYYIEHLLLKEMAMSYSYMLKPTSAKDDIVSDDMESLLSQVMENIELIYPSEMSEVAAEQLEETCDKLRSYFPEIVRGLKGESGKDESVFIAGKISELNEEPFLHSEKLKISGIPYRLINNENSLEPVIIKTGKAPENGVWLNDRLHLTSYAMLAEEMHNNPVKSGYVIYAKSGNFRNLNIRSTDRRQVLQAIGRVRKIKEGSMPDKKESPLCDTCDYIEICNVKPSLMSKLF